MIYQVSSYAICLGFDDNFGFQLNFALLIESFPREESVLKFVHDSDFNFIASYLLLYSSKFTFQDSFDFVVRTIQSYTENQFLIFKGLLNLFPISPLGKLHSNLRVL